MASRLLRLARPRTIACVGRNYADHIAELGNTRPSEPFYFLKPATSVLQPNSGPVLTPQGANVHYEVELAAVLGKTADELPATLEAMRSNVKGWAVVVDMTDRASTRPSS
jgi:acylpyruvate hydrolase